MKKKKLIEALGGVNEDYVAEANPKIRPIIRKRSIVAACILGAILLDNFIQLARTHAWYHGASAEVSNLCAHPASLAHARDLVFTLYVDFHIAALNAAAFFSGP
jgi:hypothetical protein